MSFDQSHDGRCDMSGALKRAYSVQDEPLPRKGDDIVYVELIKDIETRAGVGHERYGTYLMTNNGRDALVDAYQEAIDLCLYLKQLLMERDGRG